MIGVVRTGSGDAVCLDTQRSRKEKAVGCYFNHENREGSLLEQDFWKLVNQRISDVLSGGFLPESK
jgi:hypothetical protein